MTATAPSTKPRLVGWPLASAVILYFVVLVAVSFALPKRVPLHWNAAGQPDSYGSPADLAAVFAIIGVVLFLLFFGALVFIRRGPVSVFNVPYPGYWKQPQRQEQLRTMLHDDVTHLFTAVFLFITVVLGTVAASTLNSTQQLSWLFFVALGLFVAFMIAYIVYMYSHRYRPTE